MEVAGFAIGVVGLAGLYSTCIQLLGQIESSRMDYIAGDLHTLHARLCATNYLLKEWGRGVGLDSTGIPNSDIRHPKLADAEKRKVAFCILASVERLFENMEKLEKYGLVLKNVPILESSATVIEANAEIDKLTKNAAKKFSISRRIVWVVRDKDRFGQLLATLATLIGNLYEVIPPESAHALAVEGLTKKLAELCCSTDEDAESRTAATLEATQYQRAVRLYIESDETDIPHHLAQNKLRWRTQNSSMRPALLHLMQLPTLSSLKLDYIQNLPVSDLIHSSNLKHLVVENIDFAEEDVLPPSTPPLPPKSIYLREYTAGLRCPAAATKKLVESKHPDGLPIVHFTGLTKITGKCHMQEDIDVIRTIFIQAEKLEEVDLTIFEDLTYAGLAEMLIPSIRTLKELKLTAVVDEASDGPLSGLCHELEQILARGRSVIESLSIKVEVYTDADCKRGDEWGLLDKVLTREDAWLGLKEVSLKIEVQTYGRDDEDDLVEVLNKLPDTQFKKLSTSEAINFKFEVTEECI